MRLRHVLVACAVLAGTAAQARVEQTGSVESQQARAEMIGDIVKGLQARWSEKAGGTVVASQYRRKLETLNNARLALALRATSLEELDLLFVQSPLANGMTFGQLEANAPGNLVLPAGEAMGSAVGKATPATAPDRFTDLVYTAITPCRIYDSRFSTEVIVADQKTANSPWTAAVPQRISIGPYNDYTTFGGQATPCLGTSGAGTQNPPSRVAAIVGSVSTVNQAGPGYLVFWSYGGTNPYPGGIAQFYYPGVVQTSFVIMPTDIANPVWSRGLSSTSTHVIVDVVGYFHKPKVVMTAAVAGGGTLTRGFHAVSAAQTIGGPGTYEVIFDRDVSACNYLTSLGDNSGAVYSGQVSASLRVGNNNGIFVWTTDNAGASFPFPFFVEVSCHIQ
jgi:hypothetical protein